jgi:tripartite-type tricarboxylate transporter receptor subunit TctC
MGGPRGLPPAVVRRLDAAAKVVLERPDMQSRFDDLGVVPAHSTPQEAQKLVASEAVRWLKVLRDAGIQQQQ